MLEQNNITNNGPSVVVVSNTEDIIRQDYSNIEYELVKSIEEFNLVKDRDYDFYCFLTKGFNFINKNSISKAIKIIESLPMFTGVYSDLLIINQSKNIELYRPQQSYHTQIVLNCPFLVVRGTDFVFDKQAKEQQILHSGIKSIAKNYMLYHIPEPLFTLKYE